MKIKLLLLAILFTNLVKSQSLYFPPTVGTTWDSILPSSFGYCQPRIDSLYNYLQAKGTKSFIILKDGKRVLEKYFGTYTKDSSFYWASASKSLASFITGIAQQKGYVNINNKVSDYIGTGWTSAPIAKENLITVKNLLQMTSGLDDAPALPCDNEDTLRTCLQYKADAETRWSYHTGAYRKVQDVVSSTVGVTYNSLTNSWIKSHIGMGGIWFDQVYYSKARDMARFGLLTLNKGIWNTDTIMKDSMYYKAMVNTSQPLNNSYGYLWWLNGKASSMAPGFPFVFPGTLIPNAPSDMYCALGKNDQKIYIVPSQKIVIIRQGNTAGGFNLALSSFDNMVWDYINKLTCATNINETVNNSTYTIYPNPVTSHLTIDNGALTIKSFKIYDVLGNLITENTIPTNTQTITVDLNSYSIGLYTIEIENKNHTITRQKIVKN